MVIMAQENRVHVAERVGHERRALRLPQHVGAGPKFGTRSIEGGIGDESETGELDERR